MRKPKALRSGDRVAVLAPASPFERATLDRGLEEIRALGFEPVCDETIFERQRYVAGPAPARAESLGRAWRDPSIAGIIAVRGGYGSAQLLPLLDPAEVGRRPTVLLGCSDITALLTFLTIQCGVVGFHGPMVINLAKGASGYDRESLLACLSGTTAAGEVSLDGVEALRPGIARGPLFGGTLTQILASVGTPFAFDPPAGCVLLLDDVGERPYRIDRMLTQLRQTGILARASAVVCAEFPDCDEPAGDLTARAVVADLLSDFPGPVVFGVPTGHTARPMLTVPLGVDVTVEGSPGGRLVIEDAAVE